MGDHGPVLLILIESSLVQMWMHGVTSVMMESISTELASRDHFLLVVVINLLALSNSTPHRFRALGIRDASSGHLESPSLGVGLDVLSAFGVVLQAWLVASMPQAALLIRGIFASPARQHTSLLSVTLQLFLSIIQKDAEILVRGSQLEVTTLTLQDLAFVVLKLILRFPKVNHIATFPAGQFLAMVHCVMETLEYSNNSTF
jgi:hypothetical protein